MSLKATCDLPMVGQQGANKPQQTNLEACNQREPPETNHTRNCTQQHDTLWPALLSPRPSRLIRASQEQHGSEVALATWTGLWLENRSAPGRQLRTCCCTYEISIVDGVNECVREEMGKISALRCFLTVRSVAQQHKGPDTRPELWSRNGIRTADESRERPRATSGSKTGDG
jgi:hypothetical protein